MFKKLIPVLLAGVLFALPVFAADNIRLFDEQSSEKEVIIKTGDRLMLDKEWYSYAFEIDPAKTFGKFRLQAVSQEKYREALNRVSYPLEAIGRYNVYFLDYRLKNYASALALSFPDGSSVVFGAYHEYTPEKLHQLAVHELGHQVDFQLMDAGKWEQYKELRGITDGSVYDNSGKIYANRPQEIFAEDFRLMFGGKTARMIPHLNEGLPSWEKVIGLKDFLLSLVGEN